MILWVNYETDIADLFHINSQLLKLRSPYHFVPLVGISAFAASSCPNTQS